MRYRIRTRIEVEECADGEDGVELIGENEIIEALDGAFELALCEHEAESIDDCEQAVLRLQYAASRKALARHLEQVAQKKLAELQAKAK
jgi:hypothetical protein